MLSLRALKPALELYAGLDVAAVRRKSMALNVGVPRYVSARSESAHAGGA